MTPTKKTTSKKPAAKTPPKKKVPVRKKAVPKKKTLPKKKTEAEKNAEILEVIEEIYQEPEERNKEIKKENKKAVEPSMKLYRNIAIGFILVTLLMLAIVIILSTVRATVHIYSNVGTISTDFIADIVKDTELEGEIPGRVIEITLDETREFIVGQDGATAVPVKAGGMVTVFNTSNRQQPLVATTRLLTADGLLFRIDEGVVVPANGTVEVMAHADEEGTDGEIGPNTFTIPGLNSTRQQEVYAESTDPMTGGLEYIKLVSEEDLVAAETEIRESIIAAAQESLRADVPESYTGETLFEELIDQAASVKAGDEADSYTVSMSLRLIGVFYDQQSLLTLAEAKLYEGLEKGYQMFRVNRDEIKVEVERYDLEYEIANVHVTLEGMTMVSPTSSLLDKDNLVGLSSQELVDYLVNSGIAVNVDVQFFPFWIRKVPQLKDHIEIKIQTPDFVE